MRPILFLTTALLFSSAMAQDVSMRLNTAMDQLLADSQMNHAIVSLYVIDSKSGGVLYERNKQVGLAGASVQKVITGSTAYGLLGHDFSYKTTLSYSGKIAANVLDGNIYIHGSGDPTLGSWRYQSTHEEIVLKEFRDAIKKQGINIINGSIKPSQEWNTEMIPDGWIWEDLGSYYGAGARSLNWRENQFDLIMQSGNKKGDTALFAGTIPSHIEGLELKMDATTADKGTGDRTYIFIPSTDRFYHVRGTIPVNENHFVVSGAMVHADIQLTQELKNIIGPGSVRGSMTENEGEHVFYEHQSPPLDSIEYWFLKKSINLYGESLIKTIGFNKTGVGATDSGVNVIKHYWQERGIDPQSLNMKDGSGLSPANRITTNALVTVLQNNIQQPWFDSFLTALPEINGMKMKSGTIANVLAYTGYSKSKEGKKYTFAMIINNYNGSASLMRQKMWKLLDILK